MSKPLVSDELWKVIQPLLPAGPPKPKEYEGRFDNQVYEGGLANHQFRIGTYYYLQDEWNNSITGCSPYGPQYP